MLILFLFLPPSPYTALGFGVLYGYLLNDNNTLILVSAFKDYNQNLIYDINKKELGIQKNRGKLNFIISTYAQNCGYKSLKNNFECKIYKPLISKNLINSIE